MRRYVLTREIVLHRFSKHSVITGDLLKNYNAIGHNAFSGCRNLTHIFIPKNIKVINRAAFDSCTHLEVVVIEDKIVISYGAFNYCNKLRALIIPSGSSVDDNLGIDFKIRKRYDEFGRLIAYKGFSKNLSCRGFKYKDGETFHTLRAELCVCGFHACLNPLECLEYYASCNSIYRKVYLKEIRWPKNYDKTSKVAAKEITIGEPMTVDEMRKIAFNNITKKDKKLLHIT